MKKITLIATLLLLIIPATSVKAQKSLNEQLRELFLPLAKAPNPAPFLWDMVGHSTDEKFYRAISYDTNTTINWWTLYFEMYYSAYDTTILPHPDTLRTKVENEKRIDTIHIGLMDFDFNTFLPDALDSVNNGVWFIWDDDTIYDNPSRTTEPYMENTFDPTRGYTHEIFAMAPMQTNIRFSEVYFKIDPELIFYDVAYNSNVAAHPNPHTFQMDFDDGQGWRTIDPNTTSYIYVDYPDLGYKIIKARVQDGDNTIKYSQSAFTVSTNRRKKKPDFTIDDIAGLDVGVYLDCKNTSFDKPFIILSGIAPFESYDKEELYQQYVLETKLVMLKNHGYDFVIVDWRNSLDDLEHNRDRVISLLEHLKCEMEDDEQFVVMGISMGGVIGRAALTVMESFDYWGGTGDSIICRPEKQHHNTRLFISADAPQRGAHVPLAFQHLYSFLYTIIPNSFALDIGFIWELANGSAGRLDILGSTAVEQMLIYKSSMGMVSGQYPPHPAHTQFYNDLQNMNNNFGYPEFCKNVSISNGLFDGSHQVGFHNAVLNGGETLLDLDVGVFITFGRLWSFPLIEFSPMQLHSNSGSGLQTIAYGPFIFNSFSLKGCLKSIFKYRPSGGSFTLCGASTTQLPFVKLGLDLEPIEAMPGGNQSSVVPMLFSEDQEYQEHDPIKGGWSYLYNTQWIKDPATGTIKFKQQSFSLAGLEMTLSAEIAEFGFIPTVSAFDLTNPRDPGGIALDSNFLNTDIDILMSQMTPFDVLLGWETESNYPILDGGEGTENETHVTLQTNDFDIATYNNDDDVTMLAMEAGYDHMFLDNMKLNRAAEYTCYGDIHAGYQQNPKYNYVGSTFQSHQYPASRADKKGFEIIDGGDVIFRANDEITLSPGFSVTGGGEFRTVLDPVTPCTKTWDKYEEEEGMPLIESVPDTLANQQKEHDLIVYPNPAEGSFNIKLKTEDNTILSTTMMGINGKILFKVVNMQAKTMTVDVQSLQIPAGIYIFIVETTHGIYREKIIISR